MPDAMPYAAAVLQFWFDKLKPEQHFKSDPAVDAAIAARFMPAYERLAAGFDSEGVLAGPEPALAALIVLDQFPRNMFRGTARAFATDPLALGLAKATVERGLDRGMPVLRRKFVYLPYEHSENLDDQNTCVRLMAELNDAELNRYAEAHRVIIERFGRFPHRNAVLGRVSTAEEIEFLKQPGSSF